MVSSLSKNKCAFILATLYTAVSRKLSVAASQDLRDDDFWDDKWEDTFGGDLEGTFGDDDYTSARAKAFTGAAVGLIILWIVLVCLGCCAVAGCISCCVKRSKKSRDSEEPRELPQPVPGVVVPSGDLYVYTPPDEVLDPYVYTTPDEVLPTPSAPAETHVPYVTPTVIAEQEAEIFLPKGSN